MNYNSDIISILSKSPPRPLCAVVKGPAFVKSVVFLTIAVLLVGVAVFDVWFFLLDHFGEPLLGNEKLVGSYCVVVICILGFVFFWSAGFMNLFLIYIYRNGKFTSATVEKTCFQERFGKHYFVITWFIDEGGKITKGATSFAVPSDRGYRGELTRGDKIVLLSSAEGSEDWVAVGLMGLFKGYHLIPSLKPPTALSIARWIAVGWFVICVVFSVIATFSGQLLEGRFPSRYVPVGFAAGFFVPAVYWAVVWKYREMFYPSWWIWFVVMFSLTYFMTMEGVKGFNVWLDSSPAIVHRAKVLQLEDTVFPVFRRYCFVRSWRKGRLKEKIPLPRKLAASISQGDFIFIKEKRGYMNLPVIVGVEMGGCI